LVDSARHLNMPTRAHCSCGFFII